MISQGEGYDTSDIPTSWALNMFRIDTPKGGRKVSIYLSILNRASISNNKLKFSYEFNNVGIQLLVV